jgi:two-component system phosphate regulon sensor histidine kinase PhoR
LRFFWKIYLSLAVVIVLTAAVIAASIGRVVYLDTLAETQRALRDKALLLCEIAAPALGDWEGAGLQAAVKRLGQETHTRLTVIRADGVVMADSGEDPPRMENQLSRPEIQQAGQQGRGTARRYSATLKVEMLYYALPVKSGSRILGYTRAALPLSAIGRHWAGLLRSAIAWSLLVVLAVLILGLVVARQLSGPVRGVLPPAQIQDEG